MNRKYPASIFFMGLLLNLAKYLLIGLIGVIFLIIGFFGVDICKIIGIIIIVVYLLLCLIEQIMIRSASLKESRNPEFNEFMNSAFGVNDQEDKNLSNIQRIKNIIEEKIKSQKDDENN